MFAHIIVSGFVQGVGYRYFVKKTAKNLNLNGWVKNLPTDKIVKGRVEITLVGLKEQIEEAIKIFRKGPFLADVKDIKTEWEDKTPDLNSFEIIV